MTGKALPKIGIAVILTAAVFAAGATATWMLVAPVSPVSLQAPTAAAAVPVTKQNYSDKRAVTVEFTPGPSTVLAATADGRVTSSSCSGGATVESGTTLLSLDESPLIVLATSVPLWRDISPGDKGEDVKALQAELVRLGFAVAVDGTAGPVTVAAVAKLLNRVGEGSVKLDTVPASRIIWIPASTATIASCGAALGDVVKAGSSLATLTTSLTKVTIQQMPDDLAPGDHNLTVDSVTVPIGADGVIQDPAVLAQLATTPIYLAKTLQAKKTSEATDTPSDPISGELTLTNPIEISVVPPNAVYAITQNQGCIASAGTGYPVTIVGSQLGQTYVLFDSEVDLTEVDLVTGSGPKCR